MKVLNNLLFSIRLVFSNPRYIVLSLVTFFVVISLAIWLPNTNFLLHTATSSLFSFSQKAGILGSVFGSINTNFTLFSRTVIILVAILFAINTSFFGYFLVRAAKISKEAGMGTSAFILGMIGIGCASCGSVILSSFLGVGTTAGFIGILPLKGQEFGLLSIFLLGFSIVSLSKKIKEPMVCNAKPSNVKFLFKAVPSWAKVSLFILIAFTLGLFITNLYLSGEGLTKEALAAKFEKLSQNGNSSCSSMFKDSISNMSDNARIQGSCCSPMDLHRYSEQIQGLTKYKNIKEIPPDPYDIEAGLAKKMQSHYDDKLTPEQQEAYDYAMQNSKEKGPCCCRCWRWYVYGGLAKYLIENYNSTGQQITEVWNLSDGCGGPGDHVNHT